MSDLMTSTDVALQFPIRDGSGKRGGRTVKPAFRMIISGSRDHTGRELIWRVLGHEWRARSDHAGNLPRLTVVHGGCKGRSGRPGADLLSQLWADAMAASGLPVTAQVFEADWARLGKAAGPVRNSEMLAVGGHLLVAFPLPGSRGTWDCVRQAVAARIPVAIHTPAQLTAAEQERIKGLRGVTVSVVGGR